MVSGYKFYFRSIEPLFEIVTNLVKASANCNYSVCLCYEFVHLIGTDLYSLQQIRVLKKYIKILVVIFVIVYTIDDMNHAYGPSWPVLGRTLRFTFMKPVDKFRKRPRLRAFWQKHASRTFNGKSVFAFNHHAKLRIQVVTHL
jgi:hypothetical protein